MTPFIINSNICLSTLDICNAKSIYKSVAGNIGNSYITWSLLKIIFGGLIPFRGIQNIYDYNFEKSTSDIEYINNEATHVFFILQDQIRINESYGLKLPYDNIISFINKINKPIIIFGLGSNSFDTIEGGDKPWFLSKFTTRFN